MAQSDARMTDDQEVAGSITSGSRDIFSKYFYGHSFPLADSRSAGVSFYQNNVHKYWFTT